MARLSMIAFLSMLACAAGLRSSGIRNPTASVRSPTASVRRSAVIEPTTTSSASATTVSADDQNDAVQYYQPVWGASPQAPVIWFMTQLDSAAIRMQQTLPLCDPLVESCEDKTSESTEGWLGLRGPASLVAALDTLVRSPDKLGRMLLFLCLLGHAVARQLQKPE